MMNQKEHWENIYRTKGADEVSWFQVRPDVSLALIERAGMAKDAGILDVGGGMSPLAGYLLDAGYTTIGVLDLSGTALAKSRARLEDRGDDVEWFEADVTMFYPPHRFGLWHDRAVFHFLTSPEDRQLYIATVGRTLAPGGFLILAAFAPDGPEKCSGLEVVRYDEETLTAELGPGFTLREVRSESHKTPWQSEQHFIYCLFESSPIMNTPL